MHRDYSLIGVTVSAKLSQPMKKLRRGRTGSMHAKTLVAVLIAFLFLASTASFAQAQTYVFATKWGGPGSGSADGYFNKPYGVAVDKAGYVYVADTNNNRVRKFNSSSGGLVDEWGSGGSANGAFNHPYGIAVDSTGYVYVADTLNHRIQKFTLESIILFQKDPSAQ